MDYGKGLPVANSLTVVIKVTFISYECFTANSRLFIFCAAAPCRNIGLSAVLNFDQESVIEIVNITFERQYTAVEVSFYFYYPGIKCMHERDSDFFAALN